MLNPNQDRLDYGQLLAPPEGYKLDFAVGTTYSLDLDALVGACIALGLSEETDSELMKNPICLLEALRSTGDKVALFCEGGQIHVPNKVTVLSILLEKMVFPVSTVKNKSIAAYPSFHPKLWLIRYLNSAKQPFYRVVVLSRNLTFDRSWDVSFFMDGEKTDTPTHKNDPMVDFLSFLIGKLGTGEAGKEKLKRMKALIKELPYVRFDTGCKEFYDFDFIPTGVKKQGGGYHSITDYPLFRNIGSQGEKERLEEIFIMSPFLSKGVIRYFNDRNPGIPHTESVLITRAMSLGRLEPEDCSNFKIYVLKDGVVEGEMAISDKDQQYQKQDIHAKVYMIRKHSDSDLYLGSLNASHNGVYGNVEFMIRLRSKNRYLNMDKLKESLFGKKEGEPGNPFQQVTAGNQTEDLAEEEQQNLLEGVLKQINRLNPWAVVTQKGEFYDVLVHFGEFTCPYSVTVTPLLSNKEAELAKAVEFGKLSVTQLSEFYVIAIKAPSSAPEPGENGAGQQHFPNPVSAHPPKDPRKAVGVSSVGSAFVTKPGKASWEDKERTLRRILMIPTTGMPKDREKAVVASVVNDKACFYRYVAFLLGDSFVLSALESGEAGEGGAEATPFKKSPQLPALYEKMLQTAATAPERFKEIDYLIQAIAKDGIIPEHFEELYHTFRRAVKI